MKNSPLPLGRALCVALALPLFIAELPGFSQCPTPVPPLLVNNKQVVIPPPRSRVCCVWGYARDLDPGALKGHQYGNGENKLASVGMVDEPVGYVYTAAAGFVDVGHARDNADMVLWVYANLLSGSHNFQVGNDTVVVPTLPLCKPQILALAGAIVYVNSWAHELVTWGNTPVLAPTQAEDYSAFSPEDLPSNVVGIRAASTAILANGDASPKAFDEQMDIAIAAMMNGAKDELGAQPAAVTKQLEEQVEFATGDKDLAGKWWTYDKSSGQNGFVRLLRRNFNGIPWKVSGAPQQATPSWHNTRQFSDLYNQFLYLVSDKQLTDATQVPLTSAFAFDPLGMIRWIPIDVGAIPTAARLGSAPGGDSILLGPGNQSIASGQFATVNVNVYLAQPQAIIATMQAATAALDKAFVAANSCLPPKPCPLPAGVQDAGPTDAP